MTAKKTPAVAPPIAPAVETVSAVVPVAVVQAAPVPAPTLVYLASVLLANTPRDLSTCMTMTPEMYVRHLAARRALEDALALAGK